MKVLPYALGIALAGCSPGIGVSIDGRGSVSWSNGVCETSCRIETSEAIVLTPTPGDGWSFDHWTGSCTAKECRALPGENFTAHFAALPIEIEVAGQGRVVGSDARTCDSACSWVAPDGLTLRGEAASGWAFVDFSGSCSGTTCFVASGKVKATFVRLDGVRVEFEGDGSGSVQIGATSCTDDCEVLAPTGVPVSISVSLNSTTVSARPVTGCLTLPCSVIPPAFVRILFERGRFLRMNVVGPGRVELDGTPACATGQCEQLLARDAGFRLSAKSELDEASFWGFDGGDCSQDPECVVPPGIDDLELSAHFGSSVLWARTVDVVDNGSPGLFADSNGIVTSSMAGGSFSLDGVTYSAPPVADRDFLFVYATGWDGQLSFVRPFNDYQQTDQNQNASLEAIIRTDAGILLGGLCSGGRFNGLVACGTSSPLTLALDLSGTVRGVRADSVSMPIFARVGMFSQLGDRIVSAVHVSATRETTFGFVEPADAGFSPVFTLAATALDALPNQTKCVAASGSLVCIVNQMDGFTLDACVVPAASLNRYDPVLLRFDSELRCTYARRFVNSDNLTFGGLSRSGRDGGVLLLGRNGTQVDLGDGQTASTVGSFVAEWNGTAMSRFAHRPTAAPTPLQVEPWRDGVLVQHRFSPGQELFGETATTYGTQLTFLGADWLTPTRRWRFDDLQMPPNGTAKASRFYIEGDRVVIAVEGVRVRFGATPLTQASGRTSNLIVLKP